MESAKAENLARTYQVFMNVGMGDEDPGLLPRIVDERIVGFGSALDETIRGIPELERLLENQKTQSRGLDITWRTAPVYRYTTEDENTAVFADDVYLAIKSGEGEMDMHLRFSVVLNHAHGHWKVIHWHGSKPEQVESETDTWGVDNWKRRAQELERLVEAKTADLVIKNRELEIVAALEKVRASAMGMREPADMADVCRTISQALDELGFADIRNVQTAVFYPEKGIYLNYEYFGEGDRSLITDVAYREQPDVQAFVEEMLTSPESAFTRHFQGDELRRWTAYQHAAGQYVPPRQEAADELHYMFFSIGPGALGLSAYCDLTDEQRAILLRFRHVFALAYRRYSDIEQAHAQAREAQVEAALERVRSRSLSMHKSNELIDVVTVLFAQISELQIPVTAVGIGIYIDGSNDYNAYVCGKLDGRITINQYRLPYVDNRIANDLLEARENNLEFMTGHYTKEEKDSFYAYVIEHSELKWQLPEDIKRFIFESTAYTISALLTKHAVIHINDFEGKSISDHERTILARFANVFDQAYTRFLDLQKAEARAREAQIETALERVRSRTMSMQKSEELKEVIQVVFEQFVHLGIPTDHAGFIMDYKATDDFNTWIADEFGSPAQITIPYFDCIYYNRFKQAKEDGIDFFATTLSCEEKNAFYRDLFAHIPGLPDASKDIILSHPGFTISTVLLENVALYIENFTGVPFSEEADAILMRFGKVFQQTYSRFLDLQKAEAQAREAEIELALERIRSQAMAMRESTDLLDIVVTMRNAFTRLGHEAGYFWHMMWLPEKYEKAMTSGDGTRIGMVMELPRHIHGDIPLLADWEQGQAPTVVYAMDVDAAVAYVDKMIRLGDFRQVDPQAPTLDDIRHIGGLTFIMARTTHGEIGYSLPGVVEHPPAEDLRILERFASAFDIAHRRFLDLQKAEALARETVVSLSLERIRANAMAMKVSSDLFDIVVNMRNEFVALGHQADYFWHMRWLPDAYEMAMTSDDGSRIGMMIRIPKFVHDGIPELSRWEKGNDPLYVLALDPDDAWRYVESMNTYGQYELVDPHAPTREDIRHMGGLTFVMARTTHGEIGFGLPGMVPHPPDEALETLMRFAGVFDLAYKRFEDLRTAEAQARTARIEAALERVRARALAMQQPEELREIAQVLRHEMGLLGVEELETSTVFLHDAGSEQAECWFAIRNGQDESARLVSDHIALHLPATQVGRTMAAFFDAEDMRISIPMRGPDRREWIEYCYRQSSVLDGFYGDHIPDRVYHLYKFSNGAIGAAAPDAISEESWDLLQRTASVFSLAYARFRDLTQARIDLQKLKDEKQRAESALAELRAAQAQLVQAEKMASLGELTAGIAHEIQNPLNFVNNFADVSQELADELKDEISRGNLSDAATVADDIRENLGKILHHGKRADGIVKGMLQHSRTSSGQKEPTDLNALADEYLRLAYHGLRAKDKTFNATFAADLDPALPKVEVVPQDIGRVLLNLINNAFYAVSEKQRQGDNDYVPTVTVLTRLSGTNVEIRVTDNGFGIPETIREKIFQPFFTTKPTGQGTGLGLSISYDIVTKGHQGILSVVSEPGESTTFMISLPVNTHPK